MARRSKIVISIGTGRGSSSLHYSTHGKYFRTEVAGFQRQLEGLAILPSSTAAAFWEAALTYVLNDLMANPTPP